MSESKKKNTQKELLKIKDDLENYFANTIIPQLFVDSDMILRKFTPPAMKQFSLSKDDIGRGIELVKDNICYPTLTENIQEVISTNEILEKEIQTTDGRWFQMNILPYYDYQEKRTDGVIITFVDITTRIYTLKELEKLNVDHDTLIFALSHDIRQPISTITLLADGLMEAYKKQNTGQFTKWIQTLKNASKSLKTIVEEFTDNKNDQKITFEEERLNIENICQDVVIALKEDIHHNKIKISTDFKTSEIIFPKNNLRSIVYNLLNNAIKYSDPNKPREINIATKKIQDYVLLQVSDNGLGIAQEHQKLIFEKSAQINNETEGTGMGLFIVNRMLVNNGGKIEVESSLGKGSTFNVYFKSANLS